MLFVDLINAMIEAGPAPEGLPVKLSNRREKVVDLINTQIEAGPAPEGSPVEHLI